MVVKDFLPDYQAMVYEAHRFMSMILESATYTLD